MSRNIAQRAELIAASNMAVVAMQPVESRQLTTKEEKFSVIFANSLDKDLAWEGSGYKATNNKAKAAAISRLLARPHVKTRIEEIKTEVALANGVTVQRVVANLAEIAFDKTASKTDRISATTVLAKHLGMLTENVNLGLTAEMQRELDAKEAEECRQIALIRLRMQIEGHTTEGMVQNVQGQAETEGIAQIGTSEVQGEAGITCEG